MSVRLLADRLIECGFQVRMWKDRRIYVDGYGREISAYVEPLPPDSDTADGARIRVESRWRSPKAGLHAKGVRHALLWDLYHAGLLSQAPPQNWQDVVIDDRATVPAAISHPDRDRPAS